MPENIKQWIIKSTDGKIQGPYSTKKIIELIGYSALTGLELIATYPGGSWFLISQEPEFYDHLLDVLEGRDEGVQKIKDSQESKVTEKSKQPEEVKKPTWEQETVIVPISKTNAKKNSNSNDNKNRNNDKGDIFLKDEVSSETIFLEKSNEINSESKRIQKAVIVLMVTLGLAILAFTYFFFDQVEEVELKIHLLAPAKTGVPMSIVEVQENFKKAMGNIQNDNYSNWVAAENILVKIIEGDSQNTNVREMLCFVYKELWPYAYQDAEDLRTVSLLMKSTRSIGIGGRAGKSCEFVNLLVSGHFQEAKGVLESLMRLKENSTNVIYHWLRTELQMSERDYLNAQGYGSSTINMWPTFIRARILYSEIQEELKDNNGAIETLKIVLKQNPEHKEAKIRLGLILYKKFGRTDEALNLLIAGTKSNEKISYLLESKAYFALAEIVLQKNEKERALKYAQIAFEKNSSNQNIKQFIIQLGGADGLKGAKAKDYEMVYLGDQFYRTRDFLAAQAEYKAAFDLDKSNAIAAYKAAKCLWLLNQSTEAIEYLKKAIVANPKYIQAYVLLSDYYSQRYDFTQAQQVLNKAKFNAQNSVELAKGMAQVELRKNNPKAALGYAERASKQFDGDVEIQVIMAKSYLILGQMKEAMLAASRALEIDSLDVEAELVYSKILFKYQGIEVAIKYLENLITSNQYVMEYRLGLADILMEENRLNEAFTYYQQVANFDTKNKKARLGLGDVSKGVGKLDDALNAYLAAASIDPTDPEALFRAGVLYLETNRFSFAIQQFERVIKINKLYPKAYYFIGKGSFLLGDLQKALDYSLMERSNNPGVADSYILTAEVYTASKQYSKCTQEYQQAIKIRPQGAEIYVKLAKCYRLSGSEDVAKSMLDIAERKESGYPEIYREQGALFQMAGDMAAALKSYDKYLALSPNASDRAEINTLISELESGGQK
jgi:tetratricopeptide (TPR) repeat protein